MNSIPPEVGQVVNNGLDKAYLSGPVVFMAALFMFFVLIVLGINAWLTYRSGEKTGEKLDKVGEAVQANTVETARVKERIETLVDLKEQQLHRSNKVKIA